MKIEFEKIRRTFSTLNFKLSSVIVILLVNAVVSIVIALNVYKSKLPTKVGAELLYYGAILVTNYGKIDIIFNAKAPYTVTNFVNLAKSDFYTGTKFHRVVPSLLIEGGDPLSKSDDLKPKWGNGGPGYVFNDEIDAGDMMVAGTVAMVNNGPNTNGSQFFILTGDARFLDGQNTILGWVSGGASVVAKISKVETGMTGIPIPEVELEEVQIK